MERGNVLVVGNSGVGKSTLINAVLGKNRAKTGWGISGTTPKLELYESEEIPFRIIDTIGFEPSLIKQFRAINAVKKWSKNSAKSGQEDTKINVIWFCVDGTSRKLFPETLKNISRATAMWETVPVIVVITKSYSIPERAQNIEMVHQAFAAQQKYGKNLKKVIPVVASTYELNETAFAPPEGITELIDVTNEIMPEGIKAGEHDLFMFKLKRKKALAQSVVLASTTAAATVGAVPIPIPDAVILTPIEVAEINSIAKLYGIENSEDSKRLLNSMVEVGTVGMAAKQVINAIKAIPGIRIAASVLNAIIAGTIAAGLGAGSITVFEQVYLGEKSVKDIDWVTKVLESKVSSQVLDKLTEIIEEYSKSDKQDLGKLMGKIAKIIFTDNNAQKEKLENEKENTKSKE